jgi:hypothetical protein
MEDDMEFRAFELERGQSSREIPYHPQIAIERRNSSSPSSFSEFSTFSSDDVGFGKMDNSTDVNDFIDDPTFLEALYEYIEADEDIIEKSLNEKKKRTGSDKIDYWETKWGEMLRNPNSRKEHSREGKLWQRRFRLPRVIFDMIVEKCNEGNLSKTEFGQEFEV